MYVPFQRGGIVGIKGCFGGIQMEMLSPDGTVLHSVDNSSVPEVYGAVNTPPSLPPPQLYGHLQLDGELSLGKGC